MFRIFVIVLAIICGALSGHAEELPPNKPTLAAPLLRMQFGGNGRHEIELDGYGTCLKAHWVSADTGGGLAAANHPYVSPAVPESYNRNGAPIAYVRGSIPSLNVNNRPFSRRNLVDNFALVLLQKIQDHVTHVSVSI